MAGKIPNQKPVIVIIDDNETKKADGPGTQHGSVNSPSATQIAQNAAVPDRKPRPYNRVGLIASSSNARPHQPQCHNLHNRTSGVVTTSGLRVRPSATSSTTRNPSSRHFGTFSSQSTAPFVEPLPRFEINTDITIVPPKFTRGNDFPERQAKRPKLLPSGTSVVDLDPKPRGIIDLDNEGTSTNRAVKTFRQKARYEELRPDDTIQGPLQPNVAANAPGGFQAGDYMTEEQLDIWLRQSQEYKDATVLPVRSPRCPIALWPLSTKRCARNGPILAPLILLDNYNHGGINLKPKLSVELQDGDFMRIVHIVQDISTSAVSLRGHMFQRTREMNGVLKKTLNELCWVMHVDEDDGREQSVQAMGEVPVHRVTKRRAIKITNQPFPALSFRGESMDETEESVSRNRVLVCRAKYTCLYPNAEARDRNAYSEKVIERIREGESDVNCAIKDEQLRRDWRGDTIRGGAALKGAGPQPLVSTGLRDPEASPFALDPKNPHDIGPPTIGNGIRNRDSRGRFSPGRGSAQHQKLVTNSLPHHQRRPDQVSCDVYDSMISVADHSDPDFGMTWRTGKGSHVTRPQRSGDELQTQARPHSPEVIEVEGYIKATSKKGVVEQAYEGKITSWRSHPPPEHWSKKQFIDNQTAFQSVESFNGAASSPSKTAQQHRSRDSSSDSDLTVRGRSSSVEFLRQVLKNKVPSCPDFQLSQQNVSGISGAINPTRRYTYGDAFCGAGGMSRGALMAGLEVKWGFDCNPSACNSFLLNFRNLSTSVYCLLADQFISLQSEDHKVDILHLSPPCQTFSPAHTIDGKDDDKNSASLFAAPELLKKGKPRVVTLEQTSGIMTLHPQYLNALVQMFTELGFNIRYKKCHLQEYGLPQTRSRLIMIASCPGEVLPDFPKPTHSSNPEATGLRPFATINEAIRNIPRDAANHDLSAARNISRGPRYNGDKQSNCITTSGGGAYHPSGRKFTHREFACLSGFPLEHRFCGRETTKQIGNAVPPLVAKILLEAVAKALEKADGL